MACGAPRQRGWTLIEMLVTVAIISLLAALLMPALGRARGAAMQLCSLSNIRQLMTGYHLYHGDYNGHLMFGYPSDYVNGVLTQVRDPQAGTLPPLIAKRYPWRLIGYVSDVWDLVYHHAPTPDLSDAYGLSLAPTYGLNSFYVGGDETALGFIDGRPAYGSHAVFFAREVRHPERLIVLADSQRRTSATTGDTTSDGFYRLHPPQLMIDWLRLAGGQIEAATGQVTGVPRGRYGQGAVTAFFDGHAASLQPQELMDMRHWANDADRPDWDLTVSP